MTIITDIDHTLADAAHRDHLIPTDGGWDAYHAASVDDAPIQAVVEVISSMPPLIIAVTSRPEKWRQITAAWLIKHDIPVEEILFRPNDDYRPAREVKLDLLLRRFGSEQAIRDHVSFALEDSTPVVEMYKSIGVLVLQVHR